MKPTVPLESCHCTYTHLVGAIQMQRCTKRPCPTQRRFANDWSMRLQHCVEAVRFRLGAPIRVGQPGTALLGAVQIHSAASSVTRASTPRCMLCKDGCTARASQQNKPTIWLRATGSSSMIPGSQISSAAVSRHIPPATA